MKANEAPEKIFRTTTYLDNDRGKTLWKKQPVAGAENIEYTRTDAFIEKAVSYLEETLFNEVCYGEIRPDIVQAYIDDFKKAMAI